jgi:hypothetical protein
VLIGATETDRLDPLTGDTLRVLEGGAGLRRGRLTQTALQRFARDWMAAYAGGQMMWRRSHGGDGDRRHCHPGERQLLTVSTHLYLPICCHTLGGTRSRTCFDPRSSAHPGRDTT